MAAFSAALTTNFSGIKSLKAGAVYPQPQFQNHSNNYRFSKFRYGAALVMRTDPILQRPSSTHILSAGNDFQLNYSENSHMEPPFWLNPVREAIWTTRNVLVFLVEQPSQLKYIEWPSFRSTVKTAIFTLIIVALLIVALSSVDSALSYLLALFLRRSAA